MRRDESRRGTQECVRHVACRVVARPQSRRRTLAGSLNAARTAGPVAARTDIPNSVKPARANVLGSRAYAEDQRFEKSREPDGRHNTNRQPDCRWRQYSPIDEPSYILDLRAQSHPDADLATSLCGEV